MLKNNFKNEMEKYNFKFRFIENYKSKETTIEIKRRTWKIRKRRGEMALGYNFHGSRGRRRQ
jgi:hypothetical protein